MAIDILEREFQQSPEEIEIVNILGGEPLSNYEIIPGICDWIWNRYPKMQVFIRTNGTLLDHTMKEWFAARNEKLGLGLSIDGTPETTRYNRGARQLDLAYFKANWPDVPLKMTVFPDTVGHLHDSIQYLHEQGFNLTGGLAQGVKWDEEAVSKLDRELEKVADYYLKHPHLSPITPLLAADFEHYGDDYYVQQPCWERNPVHTYDCEDIKLPCHMFSTITQGKNRQLDMLQDLNGLKHIEDNAECMKCNIRWMCTNCPGLNYQHHGDFHQNVNKEMLCECRKICAKWSAKILLGKVASGIIPISEANRASISGAMEYYRYSFDL